MFVTYALVEERRLTLHLYDKPPVIVWDHDSQTPVEDEHCSWLQSVRESAT